MHLAILSCSNPSEDSQAYTKYPDSVTGAERIKEAAEARGHQVSRFYEPKFCFEYQGNASRSWYEAQPFTGADVIVYRPNFIEEPSLHTYVPERLCLGGELVLNGTPKILEIKNKIIQHMRLAEAGIPIPRFALAKDPQAATSVVDRLGFPLIVKVSFGTHGKGVFYAGNWETFQPILDYLDVRDGNPVILEEFIAAAQSKDIRAFVVGGRVVASMERTARSKDIRANASIGGTGTAIHLSPEDEALALRAAAVFDLDIAGVDLIRSDRGTLVLEVNANPGFRELEACTGIDVAAAIVEYAEQRVKSRNV
jgi:ribosomal protein S6--L-glutamate ligase